MSEMALLPNHDPSVWRADEIGGKAGLSRTLGRDTLAVLAEMVAATADQPLFDLKPGDFRHPALDELGRACRHELAHGRAAVVLTGLDREALSLDDFRRVYWFIGQLIGRPVVQSEKGDLLGHVQYEKSDTIRRGYTSNIELGFHTDFHELLSLASVQTAREGGESGLVSSGYIHNVMLEECPDLLRPLYMGWYDSLEGFWFQKLRERERVPDEMVPYFGLAGGKLSFHNSLFPSLAAQERGETVPEIFAEAQGAIAEIAARPGVAARFLLEPGEMVFWHNYAVMHARSEFRNAPGRERLLMRLWMHAHEKRPTPAAIAARGPETDRMLAELRSQKAEAVPAT
jgi:hypothetical protein